jgi:hypothetical protein
MACCWAQSITKWPASNLCPAYACHYEQLDEAMAHTTTEIQWLLHESPDPLQGSGLCAGRLDPDGLGYDPDEAHVSRGTVQPTDHTHG